MITLISFVNRNWNYGPNDAIVIFSGARTKFPGIGADFLSKEEIYGPVIRTAISVYGSKLLFEHNSFTAKSMQNLVWNLCSYRYLYENEQKRYNRIKTAIGFGIGEIAACVVSGVIDIEQAFHDRFDNNAYNMYPNVGTHISIEIVGFISTGNQF